MVLHAIDSIRGPSVAEVVTSAKPSAVSPETTSSDRHGVRSPWPVFAVVVLTCFVGQSFARFSFGLLLPAMKGDLQVSYGLAGWLGTINLAGYLLGTVATSVASLRMPAHRIMQLGAALATAGMIVLTTTSSVPLLLLGMALGGLGGAAAWIPAPVMAASAFAPHQRTTAMSATSGAIGVGIVLAVVVTRLTRAGLGDVNAWRPIWAIEAAIGVVATASSLFILRPIPATGRAAPPKISVLRRAPRWWSPTLAYACFGLGYVLFSTYIVSALEHDAGFSTTHATNVFALIGIGNALGAALIGRIADRVGQRTSMGWSFLLAGLGCVSALIGREPFVSIATIGFGFGMAGGVVSITSYLGRTLRPQDFSAAFGVMTACFGIAQTIGPRLGGVIVDHTRSFRVVFIVATTMWVIGGLLAFALPSRDALNRFATP